MHSNRTLATRYWLHGTAALAILVALMGCDPGENKDDTTLAPSDAATREAEARDAKLDDTGTNTMNSSRSTDRNQGATGISGEPATNAQYPLVESAVAQIKPTSAGNAEGTVTFSAREDDREMQVTVQLKGLEPGLHGFHIHEVGDCSADDASSAGGHFKPYDARHGSPGASEHHVGDMGNIEANDDGRVSSELSFRGLAFFGPASILQKAVVIHSNADDLASQPSGDAGDRIGCGVIRSDRQAQAE